MIIGGTNDEKPLAGNDGQQPGRRHVLRNDPARQQKRKLDLDALDALDALANIQYNAFDGKKVSKWIAKLLAKDAKVFVGREYSMVLYVTIPHLGSDKQGKDKELAMAQTVIAQGKKLKADETSVERRTQLPEGKFSELVIRLWWD